MIAVGFTGPNDTTRLLLVGNNDDPAVFVSRFILRAPYLRRQVPMARRLRRAQVRAVIVCHAANGDRPGVTGQSIWAGHSAVARRRPL